MFTASQKACLPAIRAVCRSISRSRSRSKIVQRSKVHGGGIVTQCTTTYKCTRLLTKLQRPKQSQLDLNHAAVTDLSKKLDNLSLCDDYSLMKSTQEGNRTNPCLYENGSDLEKTAQLQTRQLLDKKMGQSDYLFSCTEQPSEFFMNHQIRYISTRSQRKVGLRDGRKLSTKGEDKVSSKTESTDTSTEKKEEADDEKQLTLYGRFKKTYKEHGKVLVGVHVATSVVWFGTFYAIARGGVDIVPYLENWNLNEKIISPFRSGGLGDVALAYLMYKLATPARYTVTIGGTKLAISYLRKEGKMQPVPKGDTLRELYAEGKADFKSKSSSRLRKLRRRRVKRPPPGKE